MAGMNEMLEGSAQFRQLTDLAVNFRKLGLRELLDIGTCAALVLVERQQLAAFLDSCSLVGRPLTENEIRQPDSHGLMMSGPIGAKSETLRVTMVIPCTKALAAMNASRSGRGSGT